MKKIYFVPELNVVKIRQCSLLDGSVTVDGQAGLSDTGESGSAGGANSRSFSFGDDE